MEKVIFRILDSFDNELLDAIKKIEIENLGISAAINEWQISVIIRYGRFVVAENSDGKIIGVCEIFRKWMDRDSAFIHSFYIDRKYRSKGIGGKLLAFVIEMLKAGGFKSASLTVAPDNIAAVGLYGGAGFDIKELLESEYGPGTDRYLMEISL